MLRVTEIFHSIQGESSRVGLPCVFIRLTGCNLRCSYCDTAYAWTGGSDWTIERVVERTRSFGCRLVEITGGEPLAQGETPGLAGRLLDTGHEVLVETNGTLDIGRLPAAAVRIMDVKCPSSGESAKTDWLNLDRLRPGDEVKFVIGDSADYVWAKEVIRGKGLESRARVLLSPAHGRMDRALLAEWILGDRLNVRLQVPLHKIIWPEADRGR
ncbi:MAG: radical SAM protein [bacterium]|nr:radical SAM protein [bacterium]